VLLALCIAVFPTAEAQRGDFDFSNQALGGANGQIAESSGRHLVILRGRPIQPPAGSQDAESYSVLPGQKTDLAGWALVDESTCTEDAVGSWTTDSSPTHGTVSTGEWTGKPTSGVCLDYVFTFAEIYYTWTSKDSAANTDTFSATWSATWDGETYTEPETFDISLASVEVSSADLLNNKIQVSIDGPSDLTGSLSLAVSGANSVFKADYKNGAKVPPGEYSVTLNRATMPQDVYSKITATWQANTPISSSAFVISPVWKVRGIVQNTVYIKVYESACSGSETAGFWTFNNSSCVFKSTQLKPMFASQTYINGTGQTIGGALIHANPSDLCSAKYPKGATETNTFYSVSGVVGSLETRGALCLRRPIALCRNSIGKKRILPQNGGGQVSSLRDARIRYG
jgi:hypothetical protein